LKATLEDKKDIGNNLNYNWRSPDCPNGVQQGLGF
jgi:hypothetical protein